MPAGREQIANTPLSGAEVRELILADARKLVESHGLLSNHIAYGAIGYELVLRLHLKNAIFQDSSIAAQNANDSSIKSRRAPWNVTDKHPSLAALDTPPLAGAGDADSVILADKVTREIDSPNFERLREHLPIPTTRRDPQTGNTIIEMVHRERPVDIGDGNVRVDDDTPAARAAWGLPPEPISDEEQDAEIVAADAAGQAVLDSLDAPDPEAARRKNLDAFFGPDSIPLSPSPAEQAHIDSLVPPPPATPETP